MLVRTRPFDFSDRMFDQFSRSFFTTAAARRPSPTVDARWADGSLVLTVDLPGTPADAVDVSVAGRTVTIKADSEHSSWERSLRLGAGLDAEQVVATYVDGRLTVTVAPVPAVEPRRIEISTLAPELQVESDTSDNG